MVPFCLYLRVEYEYELKSSRDEERGMKSSSIDGLLFIAEQRNHGTRVRECAKRFAFQCVLSSSISGVKRIPLCLYERVEYDYKLKLSRDEEWRTKTSSYRLTSIYNCDGKHPKRHAQNGAPDDVQAVGAAAACKAAYRCEG